MRQVGASTSLVDIEGETACFDHVPLKMCTNTQRSDFKLGRHRRAGARHPQECLQLQLQTSASHLSTKHVATS